ncbi:MAG: magnesium/cobalt transporter CorA [Haloarculaceae archaeon]
MIRAMVFAADRRPDTYDDGPEALRAAKAAPGTTWVRVTDAAPGEFDRVAEAFGIHPLVVDDVRGDVRSKTEAFDEYTFTLVKDAELRTGDQPFDEEVRADPVGVVFGDDWIVTLSASRAEAVDRVWGAVGRGDERLLERGPDFVAYRVVDALVDEYFEILDRIETQIETIEEAVVDSTDVATLEAINAVRRDLLAFRKLAWASREAVTGLSRGDPRHVRPETEKYWRDVYDHLVQVVEFVETYRDLTSGARDIYLNTVSQSTNEVMKTLTVIATVFLPLTFVVGVYGMNFGDSPYNMPELGWTLGYPAAMLGMLGIAAVMLLHFRRRGYL